MLIRFLRLPAVALASLLIFTSSSFASEDMASGRFFVGIGFDYGFTGQLTGSSKDYSVGGRPPVSITGTLENDVWNGALLLGYRNENYRFTAEISPTSYQSEKLKITAGTASNTQTLSYAQKRMLVSFDKLIHLSKQGLYANVGLVGGETAFIFGLNQSIVSTFVFGAQAGINYDVKDWTFFADLRYLTSTGNQKFTTEVGTVKVMYQNNLAITFGVSYNF